MDPSESRLRRRVSYTSRSPTLPDSNLISASNHMTHTLKSLLPLGAALALAPAAAAQLSIVTNLPGTFVDISATGTALSLADDAEIDITTTVGNALLPAGTVRVGSNGGARFRGTALDLGITNQTLPNVGAFSLESQSLLPFWDDIDTEGGLWGEIYWQEVAGVLIIQWEDTAFFNGSATADRTTFQLQVPSTGTTWARFVYEDVTSVRAAGGGSATIGYQSAGWGNDVEFSFNTQGAVNNNDVLSLVGTFTPPPPPPSASHMFVSNLPGTWIDISATGTPLNLADDGEVDIPTTIGNSLFAAGIARIGSNGGVRFAGTGTELGFTNTALPNTAAFSLTSQVLLGFWDDVNTVSGTVGQIYWQETQGRLIVQWQDAGFFNAAAETVTFQIQVPSGSGNVKAQFIYQNVMGTRANGGGSATIGYQSGNGTIDIAQWSFNVAGAVMDGTVLSLVPTGPGTVGTNYCTANVNSTGQTGLIIGTGSASIAANNLTLEASRLPNNAFGYFLTSLTQAATPNPGGSQGILCIGGQIGRYTGPGQILNSGATGSFSLLINLTQVPTPTGFVVAAVGETRNFTAWHRDAVAGNATSNFTNGLSVTFQQ